MTQLSEDKYPTSDFHETGKKYRRLINGDQYIDDQLSQRNAFNHEWQVFVTNQLWGRTWSRGIIAMQDFSLIQLGMLAGAGRMEEWEIHFRVALNVTKVPLVQLREMILHIQLYCGTPIARDCMAIARNVFKELNVDQSVLDDDEALA
jgi:alkylhydroperoxidase/carboxymuconolactone decarboxylase family protein YurZ